MNTNNLFKTNQEQLLVLTDLITILVDADSNGKQYSVIEDVVPPQAGPPLHTHPDEEIFYILEGNFEFILNDPAKPIAAKVGDVITVPSNALHTFKNVGDTSGKLLTILTPGNLIDYFRSVATPINAEQDIPDMNAVPDFANLDAGKFMALAPQHDVVFHL